MKGGYMIDRQFSVAQKIRHIHVNARMVAQRARYIFSSVVLTVSSLIGVAIARAESDTEPMSFSSLTISTNSVDVSSSSQFVSFFGPTEDNLSGYGTIQGYFTSPSGNQVYEIEEGIFDESTYNGFLTFPQNAESGVWQPTLILSDASGNIDVLDSSELSGLGYSVDVQVQSATPDTTPPTLINFIVPEGDIDTENSSAHPVYYIEISDNLSDISNNMTLRFISPSGAQIVTDNFTTTPTPGLFVADPEFPRFSEVGGWNIELVLRDAPGNTIIFDSADLSNNGFPSEASITGSSDITPVNVESLQFNAANPEFNDVTLGGAAVTVYAVLSDDLSGIYQATLTYHSQSTTQQSDSWSSFSNTVDNGELWQLNSLLPPYSSGGVWLPRLTLKDFAGNLQILEHADLLNLGYDLSLDLIQNVSEELPADGSLTTDSDDDGATPANPVEAVVQTPVEGPVSIVKLDIGEIDDATNGYRFAGQQISISAPDASAEEPLHFTFNLDASSLQPGENASNIVVFRNGSALENCVDPVIADPDPCVSERTTLSDGDIQVVVRTSSASVWTLGFSTAPATYTFEGFHKSIKDAPSLNKVDSGQAIPVKFSLGGDFGTDVLVNGVPQVQKIKCSTREPIGPISSALSTNNKSLKYKNGQYRFNWKTLKNWDDKCMQLILEFNNGETAVAYFKFD